MDLNVFSPSHIHTHMFTEDQSHMATHCYVQTCIISEFHILVVIPHCCWLEVYCHLYALIHRQYTIGRLH